MREPVKDADRERLADESVDLLRRVNLLRDELDADQPRFLRMQDHLEFIRQRVVVMQELIGRIDPTAKIGPPLPDEGPEGND